ncbi:hypothetical protein [Bradyrhizobium algeriense]|uniref:hypothetical protein n=1 Tax=Bradyrhizobium algeriense TaxID=634784 RepID=UPI002FEEC38C
MGVRKFLLSFAWCAALGLQPKIMRPGPIAQRINVVRAARAPLFVAIVAGLFLAYPPQTREIYRALAEDLTGNLWQLALSLVILCAACFALSFMARELLRESSVPRTPRFTRRLLPILCGGLIPGSLSAGLYIAAHEARIGTPPAETLEKMPELGVLLQALDASRANLITAGLICTLITISLTVPNAGLRSLRVREFFARHPLRIAHMVWFSLFCLVFFSAFSVTGSQLVGPIGIFLLAVIGVGAMASLLTRAGDRRHLPVLSCVILIAILLSLFDLTDNHRIQLINTDSPRLQRAVDVFRQWYESRADREYYASRQRPYPVFIVAASGGGLYAAHHAATVLARLQDQCPNFSQHVFAISGVSGGSLGGALFANLARKQASNSAHVDCLSGPPPGGEGDFEKQSNRFIETDFLSPLLGATLFPDAMQRFLPAFTSRFDRARAFESTLTRAWSKLYPENKDNPWGKPFLEGWNPKAAAPALILNSTNVEHGYRIAMTPFEIIDMGELDNIVSLSNLAEFHRLSEVRAGDSSTARLRDTTLATAVSLSARFPWVLPAGRLTTQRDGPLRIVDGGYVENSGSETVFDLVQALARFYESENSLRGDLPPVQIHVIAITNLQILQAHGSFGLGEALSPIRTMLSARDTRAVVALSRLWRFIEVCAIYSECGKRVDGSSFTLNLFDFDLPLGWLLSPSTRKIVEIHSGLSHRAGTYLGGSNIDDRDKFARLGAYAANNDTAACNVVALIQVIKDRRC